MRSSNPNSPATQPLIYVEYENPVIAKLVMNSLQRDGYRVETLPDPSKPMKAAKSTQFKPVLLVSDFSMSMRDALALIKRLKDLTPSLKTIRFGASLFTNLQNEHQGMRIDLTLPLFSKLEHLRVAVKQLLRQ